METLQQSGRCDRTLLHTGRRTFPGWSRISGTGSYTSLPAQPSHCHSRSGYHWFRWQHPMGKVICFWQELSKQKHYTRTRRILHVFVKYSACSIGQRVLIAYFQVSGLPCLLKATRHLGNKSSLNSQLSGLQNSCLYFGIFLGQFSTKFLVYQFT